MSSLTGRYKILSTLNQTCPTFDGIVSDPEKPDSIVGGTELIYPYRQCNYIEEGLVSLSDIETWKTRFIYTTAYNPSTDTKDNNTFYLNNVLFPNYCSQTSDTCPPDPITGLPLDTCSRFIETNSVECQNWSVTHPFEADAIKMQWCLDKTILDENNVIVSSPSECDCVLKEYNPIWITLNTGPETIDPGESHCYFLPCANPTFYLALSTEELLPCGDICGLIINNYNSNPTIILPPEDQLYINCDLEPNTTDGTSNQLSTFSTSTNNQESSGLPWYLWLVIVLVILVVIGAIITIGIYSGFSAS